MTGWKHVATKHTMGEAEQWAKDQREAGYRVRIDVSWTSKRDKATGIWHERPLYICRVARTTRPRRIFQGGGVGARLSCGSIDKPTDCGQVRWRVEIGAEAVANLAKAAGLSADTPRGIVADFYEERLGNEEIANVIRGRVSG